jgi:hypothetical protein
VVSPLLAIFFRVYEVYDCLVCIFAGDSEPKKKTLMEFLLCYLPLIVSPFLGMYPVLYWTSLDIRILPISGFPHVWRNFFTISLCFIFEIPIQLFVTFYYCFVFFMVTSFVLTSIELIDSGIEEMRQVYDVIL